MQRSQQIWVRTTATSDDISGHAFASWLAERFEARGQPMVELLGEGSLWRLVMRREPFALYVACCSRPGRTDEWGAYVIADPSTFQRLVRRRDPRQEMDRLYQLLTEVMKEIPGATKTSFEAVSD